MDQKIKKLLENKGGNYIFPFFWQHGETEEVLREYMKVIRESNIRAVCVESRPHPDFLGEKWWKDMDVILDEARKRDMKVWILDDSHFPTGYANGAIEGKDLSLRRQSITIRTMICPTSGCEMKVSLADKQKASPWEPTPMEERMLKGKMPPVFEDDSLISVTAIRTDVGSEEFSTSESSEAGGKREIFETEDWQKEMEKGVSVIDLSDQIPSGKVRFIVPEGEWKLVLCHRTRNRGPHRNYINMMDEESCKVLIDTVYEPHYEHYKNDFGTTIAGFFSDEPEIGNGHLYEMGKQIFDLEDQAWSREVEAELKKRWGASFTARLPLIWNQPVDADLCAKVRYDYMDAVTRAVEKDFSCQIGNWCRAHGVQYIGHLIEDNNQHSRTGSSLGHYFRGLAGQDMAGIDNIVGQVLPCQEETTGEYPGSKGRDGHFYHYALGKLAASAAALEPLKKGRSMCEVFGAYGWSEGVQLEKHLLDHFLVRGINHYVPHAFSAKAFPDPDCPPHFYAHGNNPQYRHFGKLMAYANRMCELISDGKHIAPVGILYQGESDWTGKCAMMQEAAMQLADRQIDYDFIPSDVFEQRDEFNTKIGKTLTINGQEYRILIVPEYEYITKAVAEGIREFLENGGTLVFNGETPKVIGEKSESVVSGSLCTEKSIPAAGGMLKEIDRFTGCLHTSLQETGEKTARLLEQENALDVQIVPAARRVRYLHYQSADVQDIIHHNTGDSDAAILNNSCENASGESVASGKNMHLYIISNEGNTPYKGQIHLNHSGSCYGYNAWENTLEKLPLVNTEKGILLQVELEPLKPLVVIFDENETVGNSDMEKNTISQPLHCPLRLSDKKRPFLTGWKRSICRSIDYPSFKEEKEVRLPDDLAEEKPDFSGFVHYENQIKWKEGTRLLLEIENASEGVEVFVNGTSAGIQIAPPYRYDLTGLMKEGENQIAIEVATTLEREMYARTGKGQKPTCGSGIAGMVYVEENNPIPAEIPLQDCSNLAYRGFFYAGGNYQEVGGKNCFAGQMYVEIYVPKEILHPYPVLFLHGAAQTGCCWLYTPDGRPGWAWDFLNRGYVVYVADQPERGRSACHPEIRGPRYTFSAEEIRNSFTGPSAVEGCTHDQWPGKSDHPGCQGDPIFDEFYASQVDCLIGIAETQRLVRDAACALLEKTGPVILIGHSQAGPCVWEIADASPDKVKAMISVEPSGPPFVNIQTGKPVVDADGNPENWGIAHLPMTFDPPIKSPAELKIRPFEKEECWRGMEAKGYLQAAPARKLKNLEKIPLLLVTAECSYHAAFDWQTAKFLEQAGVQTEYWYLPDFGIHGNGHMMMLEKNSSQIADLLADWIEKEI